MRGRRWHQLRVRVRFFLPMCTEHMQCLVLTEVWVTPGSKKLFSHMRRLSRIQAAGSLRRASARRASSRATLPVARPLGRLLLPGGTSIILTEDSRFQERRSGGGWSVHG